MEKYINNELIVKNNIYLAFKDSVTCPLCSNILIEPIMCKNCQYVYCKKCIDEYSKKENKCPNKCENPEYVTAINRKNTLTKLSFECNKCGQEFNYEKILEHVDKCTSTYKKQKTPKSTNIGEPKLKRLTQKQIESIRKNKKEILTIKSKNQK